MLQHLARDSRQLGPLGAQRLSLLTQAPLVHAVPLGLEHEAELAQTVAALAALAREETTPPRHPRRAFCRKCAFEALCYA